MGSGLKSWLTRMRFAGSAGLPRAAIVAALPSILFVFSIAFFAFLYGVAVGYYQFFPFTELHSARVSAQVIYRQLFARDLNRDEGFVGFTDIPLRDLHKSRIVTVDRAAGASEEFLFTGGIDQYYDYCPRHGCIAVRFRRDGSMVHAWPFLPEEFQKTPIVSAKYETALFDYARNIYSAGLTELPDGSLISVFFQSDGFPSGGGVARIAPDGHFIWFRRDYSHHWPVISGNEIVFSAAHILSRPTNIVVDGTVLSTLDCQPSYIADTIRVVDLNGRPVTEISIFDALLASPYRAVLLQTINKCDPLHVNYVTPVGEGIAKGLPGVSPSDFLVSMRHISALAIISRETGRLLRLFRGDFFMQHAVHPFGGTSVIMFDNLGAGAAGGPSRLLVYDLATGAERTLFPLPGKASVPFFSEKNGTISLSADGTRAIVAVTDAGRGYEIRLSDGAILTKFDNLSDVSMLGGFEELKHRFAARFDSFGLYYAP